ncbi:hypothetical protein D9M68_954420 [compost metagenome]
MPALCPACTGFGFRTWSSTWATVAVWPLGMTLMGWPGITPPVATRPQKTRRPWLVSEDEENFSTHCTGNANGSAVSAAVTGRCSRMSSSVGPL